MGNFRLVDSIIILCLIQGIQTMILRYANHVQTQTPTCAKVQQTKISHGKLFLSKCKPQNLGDSKEFCIILS